MSDDKEQQAKAEAAAASKDALKDISDLLKDLTPEDSLKLVSLVTGTKPKTFPQPIGGDRSDPKTGLEPGAQRFPDERVLDDSKMPKIPKFSGTISKTEPSFRVWRFEVENLQNNFREAEVRRAIHRSVTGSAAEVLMRMGQDADSYQILNKFENIFGTVSSSEKLLCDFYSTQQKSNESVAEWSCRLEDILSHRQLESIGQRNIMLKSKFFSGLHSSQVKNAIRHRFNDGTYDDLLVLAREAEEEFKVEKAISKPQTIQGPNDKLEKLMEDMKIIKEKISKWEERSKFRQQSSDTNSSFKSSSRKHEDRSSHEVVCYYCKKKGHVKKNCSKLLNKKRSAAEGSQ
jgi:hypothetical protein